MCFFPPEKKGCTHLVTILDDVEGSVTEVALDFVVAEFTVGIDSWSDQAEFVLNGAQFLAGASFLDCPCGHQVQNIMFDLSISNENRTKRGKSTHRVEIFAIFQQG